jgi:hypothetical protein
MTYVIPVFPFPSGKEKNLYYSTPNPGLEPEYRNASTKILDYFIV